MMFKKYLSCESGEADSGTMGGLFLSLLFIAVICVALALSYGFKLNNIFAAFTDKF
jgi:hypothetical protein